MLVACNRGEPVESPTKNVVTAEATEGAAAHRDEPEHEELPTKVRLSEQVVTDAAIKTAAVAVQVLPLTVDLTGEIAIDPDSAVQLPARAPGRVVDVRFKEGQKVRGGDVVAVLESPDLARARAAYTSLVAKADTSRVNAERLQNLATRGLASGQEVAVAKAEAVAAGADAQAARQGLSAFGPGALEGGADASRLEIRSPISGYVLTRDAMRGQTLEPSHVLGVVADLDSAYFLARLFEKDLERVDAGAAVEVRLNAYPSDVFAGTVETVGRQLDAAARTVIARILIKDHTGHLKVGLFGTARVTTRDRANEAERPVVPLNAVTKIGTKDVVFVQHADGDFEVHPVSLGRSAGGQIEVLAGLRQGESVVVDGVFTLKSAVLKSTFGEEE